MNPNQESNQPKTPPTTDLEKVVIKLSKDIEYLKEKVVSLETEAYAKNFNMTRAQAKEEFVEDPPSKVGHAKGYRPLLESEIIEAQSHYQTASEAARYLKVSYKTYKKHATRYGIFKTNPKARKPRGKNDVDKGKYPLNKILSGEIIHPKPWKLKYLIFRSGKKDTICERCGWREPRADGIHPLVINFMDGDQKNQKLENIKIYCYNCTFVLRGYVKRGIVVFDNLGPV